MIPYTCPTDMWPRLNQVEIHIITRAPCRALGIVDCPAQPVDIKQVKCGGKKTPRNHDSISGASPPSQLWWPRFLRHLANSKTKRLDAGPPMHRAESDVLVALLGLLAHEPVVVLVEIAPVLP